MMKQTYCTILFLLSFALIAHAQNLTVESFTPSTSADASVHPVNDNNGQACALVKVYVTDEMVDAKGPFVIRQDGSNAVTKHGPNEYWVYLANGAKNLTVATRNYKPLQLWFRDYKVPMLQSKVTYQLSLNTDSPAKKQRLIINYSPANALVIVDSKPYQGNGHIEIPLSVGSHEYQIAAIGYVTAEGTVKLSEEAPRIINETLQRSSSAQNNATETPLQGNTASTIAPSNTNTTSNPTTTVQTTNQSSTIQAPNTPSPDGIETFTVGGVTFKMIKVEGGTFTMGATSEQGSKARPDEKPTHRVTLSTYYIGETEVTQALWQAVMGTTVSQQRDKADKTYSLRGEGANYPMYYVSWEECQEFVRKLNRMTGKNFRLPTEAEWEFAARGGNKTTGYKYSGSNAIDNVAWYDGNSGRNTHDVKTKSPNELGIYDMSGNVCEWCQDRYDSYSSSPQTNPTGPTSGFGRVFRGGSWSGYAKYGRVSRRGSDTPVFRSNYLGLRLAL